MKKSALITVSILLLIMTSCVSKKKYVTLQDELSNTNANLSNTKGELQKTTIEKEKLEAKFDKIQQRVEAYNTKINSLSTVNNSLTDTNNSLSQEISNVNYDKLIITNNDEVVISESMKNQLANTLSRMTYEELAGAKNLKDSLNLAIAYNMKNAINLKDLDGDINIRVDKTVVMISVSDKMLFSSGSYKVKSKANKLIEKLAQIINSEPSMDVIIEGHTDSKSIHTATVKDNWDLSVKRATSIVRLLQKKHNVDPSRMIASGRSSYIPIADNKTRDGRAKNRRTNIIILPNLNKFFALLDSNTVTTLD
ncbi:MAG: OmpA family protein [Flavobacteriaceae bacterium]